MGILSLRIYNQRQETNKYNTDDIFYHNKVIEKIIPTLKGGKMMVFIVNVYTNEKGSGKDWREITQPMCELLESEGLTYKGCIGMQMIWIE